MLKLKNYGWEIALFLLLIIEIVGFGVLNPRMLDINVLLYSTSDFIYIGMLALPLTMIIVSGGIDISFVVISLFQSLIILSLKTAVDVLVPLLTYSITPISSFT